MILILLLFSPLYAAANTLTLADPHYLPREKVVSVELAGRNGHKEIEYEANDVRIDQQDYRSEMVDLKILTTPIRRLTVGVAAGYETDRQYELSFGPESTRFGDPIYTSNTKGFTDPELILAYTFDRENEGWTQQVYLQFNPFKGDENPNRIYRGGYDAFLEYRFGRFLPRGTIHGKLYSHYFGKKRFHLPGDERLSTSDAYTEVGIHLGYIRHLNRKWRLRATGMFGLTSDYRIETPDVQREANKGFQLGVEGEISYFFKPHLLFGGRFRTDARVYNANNEQLSRNIDYEIEERVITAFLAYEWGLNQ